MKKKLLAVTVIVGLIFVVSVLWRMDGFIFGDRTNWAEAQVRGQMVSIHHALLSELKSVERLLPLFEGDNFQKDKINWNVLQPYYGLATAEVNAQGRLQTLNWNLKDKSPAQAWAPDFLENQISGIALPPSVGTQVYVKSLTDSTKAHHVLLIFANRNRAHLFLSAGELFQSLIDAQKGSLSSFTLVSSEGLTIGHNIPDYVGTSLAQDVVYKAAQKSAVTQGLGVFDSAASQDKIFGAYDKLPNTNLWIVSSANMNDIMKGRTPMLLQFLILGAGLILLGVGGVLLVILPHEKSLDVLRTHVQALVAGRKDFVTESMTPEILDIDEMLKSVPLVAPMAKLKEQTVLSPQPQAVVTEKPALQAYRQIASSLGYEMRAPLTTILGYSQMILAQKPVDEIRTPTESIIRESRSARAIIEKLFNFAGEQILEKSPAQLATPLLRALKNVDSVMRDKGIQIQSEILTKSELPISVEDLTRAFENILQNAVEASDRMLEKKISVRAVDEDRGVLVEITDAGEGISPENLDKIFDPFFTTRSYHNHHGLGLSVAMGILKEHGVELKVSSELGKGTSLKMHFPVQYQQAAPAQSLPKPPTPPPKVLDEKQHETIEQLQVAQQKYAALSEAEIKMDHKPTDVNIDSLLELPPESVTLSSADVISDEITLNLTEHPHLAASSVNCEVLPLKMQFDNDTQPLIDQDVPVAIVTAPKTIPPPPRKSKLDSFEVKIPRPPGKGI